MLTLYHAAPSRSSRIVTLLKELDVLDQVTVRRVSITRQDGSGTPDAANPHPEGKVPLLDHDGSLVWESNAIMLYLTDLFPEGGMGPVVGEPTRGAYLSWLAYYGNVMEPVVHFEMTKIDSPAFKRTFRSAAEMNARIGGALRDRPYLLGERYSAADLLICSVFAFMPQIVPDDSDIRAWIDRCISRPSVAWTTEFDAAQAA